MIALTSAAAAQLRALVEEKGLDPASAGLRLAVEKGGCAGLEYAMSITTPQPGDLHIQHEGASLYVAQDSLSYLDDSIVDYEDGLAGAGFRIRNPHATRTCGCGTSFEPAGTATGHDTGA